MTKVKLIEIAGIETMQVNNKTKEKIFKKNALYEECNQNFMNVFTGSLPVLEKKLSQLESLENNAYADMIATIRNQTAFYLKDIRQMLS